MGGRAIVVMGVSGSGKSTLGRALAGQLGLPFFEGDGFHPETNIEKMRGGQPLTDADRAPWLAALNALLGEHARRGESLVLACSALKQTYREQLRAGGLQVTYLFLKGSYDLIAGRIGRREHGHFMPASLLQSQFDALEEPQDAIVLDAALPVDELLSQAAVALAAGG